MADTKTVKEAFERNRKVLELRPQKGKKTIITKVRRKEGTTCKVEHKQWSFNVDIGTSEGGNDAGPGPGILQRGALGSCLLIGYVQHAAVLDVPVNHIEVNIMADKDLRGRFGINDGPPGSKKLRYEVLIKSPASEEEVQKVIEKADHHSPVLDDFKRAVPVEREITIKSIENEREAS